MKIQYKNNIEEAVDANFRFLEKTEVTKKSKKSERSWGLFISLLCYFALPYSPLVAFPIALCLYITLLIAHFLLYDRLVKRSLREQLMEAGITNDTLNEYEFNEEGVIFKQGGMEIKFLWETITDVKENENDFELISGKNGICVIWHRIFSSAEEINKWISFAKEKSAQG